MSERSGWQLADVAVAEAYDRFIMSTFGNAWAQLLVQAAAPGPGDRLLDIACGTGAVARYAAPLVESTGRVIGLDLNSGMLAMAQAIPQRDGVPVEWQHGNATSLPLPDSSFDIVCCQQGQQFFPDQSAALAEMFRVLVPSGRVALGVWRGLQHQPFYAALAEALDRYVNIDVAASLRAAFTLSNADELRALVTAAGFGDVRVQIRSRLTRYAALHEFVLGYISGTPMAGAVAALDDATRQAMVNDVCASLRAYVDSDGMAARGKPIS